MNANTLGEAEQMARGLCWQRTIADAGRDGVFFLPANGDTGVHVWQDGYFGDRHWQRWTLPGPVSSHVRPETSGSIPTQGANGEATLSPSDLAKIAVSSDPAVAALGAIAMNRANPNERTLMSILLRMLNF